MIIKTQKLLAALCIMLMLPMATTATAMLTDFEPIVGTITGQDTVITPFEVTADADLTFLLTDLMTPAPFTNLGLAITTENADLLSIINTPGFLDISLAPGNYLAIVGGVAGPDSNIGTFGLEISDLPIPGAVYLLGSGLLGMLTLSRRRTLAV